MIISHKYKFIFVKTKKTAGTSIEVFLSDLCGNRDIFTPIAPPEQNHRPRNYKGYWNLFKELKDNDFQNIKKTLIDFYSRNMFFNHMRAEEIRKRISPRIWNSYFKFCVDRNPWDKTVSHYYMRRYFKGDGYSISDYFAENKFCINMPYYTNSQNELLVDKVLKYENLSSELGIVFAELGIPYPGELNVYAKSNIRVDGRKSYFELFSKKQIDIISKVFRDEINAHGYELGKT